MIFYDHFSASMQRYLRGAGFLFLVGLMVSSFALAYWLFLSGWSAATSKPAVRQLAVSGEGKVAVRPDIATFTAGVVTEATRVKAAQSENTSRSNRVITFLTEKGIAEKDRKTIGYSIFPQYQYFDSPPCLQLPCPPRRPPEIVSYQVRHTLEVRVRDLEKVDELLEGVVSSGANEVGSITFGVEDEKRVRAEARKQAIEDAKAKAEVLAKDLGIRLGRVMSFSESGGGIPIFLREAKGGDFGGDIAAPAPQVEPGEQEIRSNLTITYEFR